MTPSFTQQREFRVLLLVLGPLLLFILGFGGELWTVGQFLFGLFFGRELLLNDVTVLALGRLLYEALVFGGLFAVSLALVAQFVLPVQTNEERRRVIGRLWLYVRGRHGPAIFVKDGKLIASSEERENQRQGPGVALVDSASALALEREHVPQITLYFKNRRRGLAGKLYWLERTLRRIGGGPLAFPIHSWRWAIVIFRRKPHQYLLALGFAKRRPAPPPKGSARVEGAGIVFTNADERVRDTLDLRRQTRSRPNIKGLTRDGLEVTTTITVNFMLDDQPRPLTEDGPARPAQRNNPAFPFNRQNAFRAVYGSPVGKDEDEVQKWTDLPTLVASDIFRDLISTQTLDSIFRPTQDDMMPLEALKNEFKKRVQSEPVLKERGIKVLSASFGKLTPPDSVTAQRIKSWQAEWERRKLEMLAGGDLQATRIVQRARINAQYDMVRQMNGILQKTNGSKPVVALRLFQALEAASTHPSVRRLLPTDTVAVLNGWLDNLRFWFSRRSDTP